MYSVFQANLGCIAGRGGSWGEALSWEGVYDRYVLGAGHGLTERDQLKGNFILKGGRPEA